ncbi:hypothetical protein HRbin11_00706 [bacterium HR11]|nr:hypothetical protein HRbin11_00706 [bacterium HR11]
MRWPMTWGRPEAERAETAFQAPVRRRAAVWVFWGSGWHHSDLWEAPRLAETQDLLARWGDLVERWSAQVPPDAVLWRLPGLYVFWWAPHEDGLTRTLYHWLALHKGQVPAMQGRPRLEFRVGAAVGDVWCLEGQGGLVEAWGPATEAAAGLARRAPVGTVWVERSYYEAVYTYLPGRSRPPVPVPGYREALPVYQMEWGLPGRYLLQPPP